MLRNVAEATNIDDANCNMLWQEAINKYIYNYRVAFEILGSEDKSPVGYKEIMCNLIFEVKIDLTRKAQYAAGGHLTDPPYSVIYASVVSQEIVRIYFLVSALNYLDIL